MSVYTVPSAGNPYSFCRLRAAASELGPPTTVRAADRKAKLLQPALHSHHVFSAAA